MTSPGANIGNITSDGIIDDDFETELAGSQNTVCENNLLDNRMIDVILIFRKFMKVMIPIIISSKKSANMVLSKCMMTINSVEK